MSCPSGKKFYKDPAKRGDSSNRFFLLSIFSALLILFPAGDGQGAKVKEDMVTIPAGGFTMGFDGETADEWGDEDETPVHTVLLDAYRIDRYETTSADFAAFLNTVGAPDAEKYIGLGSAVTIEKTGTGYRPRAGLDRHPANGVTWYGADAYCRRLGKRLPTEAEWEKAARGTDERIFPWGDRHPDNSLATYRRKFPALGFKAIEPVDSMPAGLSPYGLHHMAGNVWEWVADWYADDYYRHSPSQNPQGPSSGATRVLRGGNWYYKAYYMRTTYRFNDRPESAKVWQGFRCAASP